MSPIRRVPLFVLFFFLLTATVSAYAQSALQFVAVTPCRVVDTRNPDGEFGGPTMEAGTQRDFPIPQSACSIPNTALAYSLNVTVVPSRTLNYLTAWPTGQSRPVVSTLNSYDGRVKANAAIVPAGTDGAVSVYVTDKTDVILDIDGYFKPADTTTLAFFPLTPCRVADTRGPTGTFGGPSLQGNQQRIFPVLQSSCNIPDSAQGYSLNFTVVPQHSLNYLTVWPTGQQRPFVSTLNAPTGTIVANAALVPASSSGAISVFATDNTDLIIDIDGYFAPSNSGRDALSLYTLSPCRVLDTRNLNGAFSGTLPVDVLGSGCNVPGAEAYVFNATVVPWGGPLGYLSLWPDAEGKPYVSTLNAADGAVTSNMAIVPTLNGDVDAYAFNPTQLIMDISSYFAPILPLNVVTAELPSGTVNYGYSTTLAAAGGVLPYTWSVTSGNLPPGLQLDPASGVIYGTPTLANDYPFTVQVTDAETPPVSAGAPLDITVNSTLAQLIITTTTLPNGTQNTPYNANLAATGGVTPYTWSVVSGSLPGGLNLNTSTGAITGTPNGAGVSNFTVQVTDSNSPHSTATKPLSITVSPAVPLSISTTTLPNGNAGTAYSAPITAIGGVYPYAWSVTSGTLPTGLHLNASTGVISGTPTVLGTSNFTVQVTDSETPPVSALASLSITINAGVIHITTTSLPNGTAGQPYNATLTATGGVSPYTWSVIAGQLPSGLTLNSNTGVISSTPTVVGTSNFTVQATDSETPPVSATAPLSITINPNGGGNPGLLSGNYAFYMNGFNASTQWTLAGSFISDGNGHITSAVVDFNSITGAPYTVNLSGTYSISTTGLNTMTLQSQVWGPMTIAFVLDSSGNGRIIEYDDTTGQGSRAAGELRKANSSAFTLNALNGGWVFGMTGASSHSDGQVERFVNVGQFALSNGNFTNGTCDMNDGGQYQTCTFTGTVSAVDPQSGRATVSGQSNNGTYHLVIYVVSTTEMLMEQADTASNQGPMEVGTVESQNGPFNDSSLSGTDVMIMQDIHGGDGLDQSVAGILSFDGHGNGNTIAMDEDLAGTITQDQPSQSTYSVQSNGALSIQCQSGGCPVGFLFAQNKGMVVGTGSSTIFGQFGPQTGGPFSNASIAGTYAGGSLAPLDYANAKDELLLGPADGNGTWVVSVDSSGEGGLEQGFGIVVNYTIGANGRGTAEAQGDQAPTVVYVISPTKFVLMFPHSDARMDFLEH